MLVIPISEANKLYIKTLFKKNFDKVFKKKNKYCYFFFFSFISIALLQKFQPCGSMVLNNCNRHNRNENYWWIHRTCSHSSHSPIRRPRSHISLKSVVGTHKVTRSSSSSQVRDYSPTRVSNDNMLLLPFLVARPSKMPSRICTRSSLQVYGCHHTPKTNLTRTH